VKLRLLCIAGGNVKWFSHCGKVLWILKEVNPELAYDGAIPLLGIHPKKLKAETQTDICVLMFTITLSPIIKR
jgi:hypothetical protein